jgi:hypothetical protein
MSHWEPPSTFTNASKTSTMTHQPREPHDIHTTTFINAQLTLHTLVGLFYKQSTPNLQAFFISTTPSLKFLPHISHTIMIARCSSTPTTINTFLPTS